MEGSERLAYDDPHFESDATVMGVDCLWGPVLSPHTPGHVTPDMPGSPMDRLPPMEVAIAVEVHMNKSELEDL